MKRGIIKRYFLTGLFVLVPFGASALILTWLFRFLDSWAHPLTERLFGHHIPGVGLLTTVLVILTVGFLSSNMVGRWLFEFIDHLLLEVPIFRSIYSTMKQMVQFLSPESTHAFQNVVLVKHPETGALSMGFATHEVQVEPGEKPHVAVYLPTNHVYLGTTLLFPPEDVRRTSISVQDAIQSAISAGATLPKNIPSEPWS